MEKSKDLNPFIDTYSNDPFHNENQRGLNRYVHCCIQNSHDFDRYLELGIGHGVTLNRLSQQFKQVIVLEGASNLVKEYREKYSNVEIIETWFETFSTQEKFNNIGMGFILEHVDDPMAILKQFAGFLTENGRIFVGVPSASSMHRLLAQQAGLLENIEQLSAIDLAFGHKRLWSYQKWRDVIESNGFTIEKAQGIAFKPFTTPQLASLNLDLKVIQALDDLSTNYPELANALFFEISHDQ